MVLPQLLMTLIWVLNLGSIPVAMSGVLFFSWMAAWGLTGKWERK